MKLLAVIVVSVFFLAVAVFCAFGFMATFEPTDNKIQFIALRVGYVGIGIGCIAGIAWSVTQIMRRKVLDARQ